MNDVRTEHGRAQWPWPVFASPERWPLAVESADGRGFEGTCRGIDLAFADFVVRLSGGRRRDVGDPLWLGALVTSVAAGEGEVRVDLDRLAGAVLRMGEEEIILPPADEWRAALLDSPAVTEADGEAAGDAFLVLSRGGLYLRRFWLAEREVAAFAAARTLEPAALPDGGRGRLAELCPLLFPGSGGDEVDWQMVAALAAVVRSFAVISGGPGSGKTYTAARVISLLSSLYGDGLRLALAAPTGKAASRLKESVAAQSGLPGVGDFSSFTLHRLLGIGADGEPRYGPGRPLPYDLVIVDEASMVDLSLMHLLVRALSPDCRLVLLGDHQQLAAVEPGSVFAAFCAPDAVDSFSGWFRDVVREVSGHELPGVRGAGGDGVVFLRKSRRFRPDGGIGLLAAAAAAGDGAAVVDMLAAGNDPEVVYHRPGPDLAADLAAFLMERRSFWLPADLGEAFAWLERFRILCPFRSGPGGVEDVNRLVLSMAAREGRGDRPWGMPLLVRRNDYDLGLYNGDIGVVSPGDDARAVFQDADGGVRYCPVSALPDWEPVYAMTVHKSQGSEFDEVLLLLPRNGPSSGRELFYTAVTRARKRVHVWGEPAVIRDMVCSCGLRETSLAARIAELLRSG